MGSLRELGSLLNEPEDRIFAESEIIGLGNCVRENFEDEYHFSFMNDGFELMFDRVTRRLKAIFIRMGTGKYFEDLKLMPCGLSFNLSRKKVRQVLGDPHRECKLGAKTILGPVQPWDMYCKNGLKVTIRYAWDELSIDQITCMKDY